MILRFATNNDLAHIDALRRANQEAVGIAGMLSFLLLIEVLYSMPEIIKSLKGKNAHEEGEG